MDNKQHACPKENDDNFEKVIDRYWIKPHEESPDILYHYTGADGLKSIVENGKMWASVFECMNDNQEFRHGLSIAQKEIQEAILRLPTTHKTEMVERWKKFFESESQSPDMRPYILSFCENNKNKHLWENYATAKGACLRLENSRSRDLIYGYLVNVDYDSNSAVVLLRAYLDEMLTLFSQDTCEHCLNKNMNNLFMAFLRAAFRLAVALKEPKWSEEKEWRLVVFGCHKRNPQSSHGPILHRTRGGTLIDFLEIDLGRVGVDIIGIELGLEFPNESKNSVKILASKKMRIKVS